MITGKIGHRGIFSIHKHHYILQQNYKKYKEWYEKEGIEQKTFWLHYKVHSDLHCMISKKFNEKYEKDLKGKERKDYLFNKKEYFENLLF